MVSDQSATQPPDRSGFHLKLCFRRDGTVTGHTTYVDGGTRGVTRVSPAWPLHRGSWGGAEEQSPRQPQVRCRRRRSTGRTSDRKTPISILHDRLEENEWLVDQGRGLSGVDKCRQKDDVDDICQFRDGLADDCPPYEWARRSPARHWLRWRSEPIRRRPRSPVNGRSAATPSISRSRNSPTRSPSARVRATHRQPRPIRVIYPQSDIW